MKAVLRIFRVIIWVLLYLLKPLMAAVSWLSQRALLIIGGFITLVSILILIVEGFYVEILITAFIGLILIAVSGFMPVILGGYLLLLDKLSADFFKYPDDDDFSEK